MHVLPENIFKKFLQCELCQGNFKEPKLLPCKHTFCQRCLERHLLRSTTTTASLWFLCPTCRNITDTPKEGIGAFKSNYFVLNLSGNLDSNNKRVEKSLEQSGRSKLKTLLNTKSTYVKNGSLKRQISTGKNDCDNCVCGENSLTLYCEDCRFVACGDCFQKSHEGHTFNILEEQSNKDRDVILSTINQSREDVNKIQEGLENLNRYKKSLRNTRDETVGKVRKRAQKIRELIDQLEEDMVKEIDGVYTNETEKVSVVWKHNSEVSTMLKTLNEFSDAMIKEGRDSQIVLWKHTIHKQHQMIRSDAKNKAVNFMMDNPLDMRYDVNEDLDSKVKSLLGKIEFGKSIDLFDEGLRMTSNQTEYVSEETGMSEVNLLKNCVHEASLVKSFSIFTDGSQYSPLASDIAIMENDDIVAVDRNNKTVKIFGQDGGMYRKIYGSECVWGLCPLEDGTLAVTDNTVHIFDTKGRLLKVLRQQPRDSHGIAKLSNGHVVVTDCSSRCIYILSTIGGTIQRIITQRGRQPFRQPQYVAVMSDDNIIISDASCHTVTVLTNRGRYVGEFGVGGKPGGDNMHLNMPSGVIADKMDNIVVCDKMNDRLVLLDREANFLCVLVSGKGNLNHPQAITLDSAGNIVVVEETGKVKVYRYREKSVETLEAMEVTEN